MPAPADPSPAAVPEAAGTDVRSADAVCADLASYIDASPSPYHAVESSAARLASFGFVELDEREAWRDVERGFVRRGGGLIAWAAPDDVTPSTPLRVVGAHTDSPNLRLKPRPDAGSVGIAKLGVEVYGGVLLNSWLDRDLGLSGRVALRPVSGTGSGEIGERLLLVDRPVARVPQLAIHLDREINERGLLLDRQRHLSPMWAEGSGERGAFARWLAEELAVEVDAIAGWDLMFHDLTPSRRLGRDDAWLAAPRIDNLASCHAGTEALVAGGGRGSSVAVLALFDHEEVGSVSATGAQGPLLSTVLSRRHEGAGGSADDFHRAIAASVCISADGAHATHPNMAERHEPEHHIAMNAGPVIKRNANERYATTGVGQAVAAEACRVAGVPHQLFVNRTDLACGSTIGPLTAAQLGMATVDMGIAQLSMHSARELCGAEDPAMLVAALTAFLEG